MKKVVALILFSMFFLFGIERASAQMTSEETMCYTAGSSSAPNQPGILLSVNGTLMRGLKLAQANMIGTGSSFVADVLTAPAYGLFAMNEDHPAMFRGMGNTSVVGEVWCVPFPSVSVILAREPAGLGIGKVALLRPVSVPFPNGARRSFSTVLGVIGEEISLKETKSLEIGREYDGSFREYVSARGLAIIDDFLKEHTDVSKSVRDQVLISRKQGLFFHLQGVAALKSSPPAPFVSASAFIRSVDSFHHAMVLLGIGNTLYPLPLNASGAHTSALTPNEVLDRYFDAVSHKNIDAVLSIFNENAVIVTAGAEYHGHDAIASFYQKGIFQCKQFRPDPGPRHIWENQIAVEIGLYCNGESKRVGDFFTLENGKITRMAVYSGPGYTSAKAAAEK